MGTPNLDILVGEPRKSRTGRLQIVLDPRQLEGLLFFQKKFSRTSPVVQWLRLHASTAGAQVRSLVWEIRSRMPRGVAKKTKTTQSQNFIFKPIISTQR